MTAYDEQHKWYKIKYDDGDGEELNPKEPGTCSPAPNEEDDSGPAPEFIDLTSEDDEPDRTPEDETHSDTADVAQVPTALPQTIVSTPAPSWMKRRVDGRHGLEHITSNDGSPAHRGGRTSRWRCTALLGIEDGQRTEQRRRGGRWSRSRR